MKTSIVITAYNVEQYIAKSIISAMQEGVDEIIIVEDKSTDNTLNVIKEIKEHSNGLTTNQVNNANFMIVHQDYDVVFNVEFN